jgi:hypothetical protein
MSRPKTDMPWLKPCGHPGCKVTLRKDSRTYDVGFCAQHGGRQVGRAVIKVAAPYVPPERPGIRVVEIAAVGIPAAGSSGEYRRAKVSLPKEPWA